MSIWNKKYIFLFFLILSFFLSAKNKSTLFEEIFDPMETTAGWQIYSDSTVEVWLSNIKGFENNALEINYEMNNGSWFGIFKEVMTDISKVKKIRFVYRGEGNKNSVEVKLEDKDGTQYGIVLDTKSNLGYWKYVEIPISNFRYFYGGDKNMDFSFVKYLHFAVSVKDKDESGKGKLVIDNIEFIK